MIINNHSKIIYSLGDEKNILKKSNIVKVQLINPIIMFIICQKECQVIVKIKNNSGVKITDLVYQICSLRFEEEIIYQIITKNSFEIRKSNYRIYLGSLENTDFIILKYQIKDNYLKRQSILSYDIKINHRINRLYITNRTMFATI